MAKVVLPFAYSVEGIPHKGRKLREFAVIDNFGFEIPETSLGDAPICLRWSLDSRPDANGLTETRWFDGKLYRPVSYGAKASYTPDDLQEAFEGNAQKGSFEGVRDFLLMNLPHAPFSTADRIGLIYLSRAAAVLAITGGLPQPRHLADDEGPSLRVAQRAYADTLLLIGDAVWTSVGAEPSWRVDFACTWRAGSLHLGSLPVRGDVVQFRADQFAAAAAFVGRVDGLEQATIPLSEGYVEVLRPDLLTDETVLLYEGLLGAVGHWSIRETSEGPPNGTWGRCAPDVQALVEVLCGLAGSERPDRKRALEVLDIAAHLLEALGAEDPKDPALRRVRADLEPTVLCLSMMQKNGTGLSDEEEDQIASAFDV